MIIICSNNYHLFLNDSVNEKTPLFVHLSCVITVKSLTANLVLLIPLNLGALYCLYHLAFTALTSYLPIPVSEGGGTACTS